MTEVNFNPVTMKKLQEFKRVVDQVLGKESDFNKYLDIVMTQGLFSMIRDITKNETIEIKGQLKMMFEKSPELVTDFISKKLKQVERTEKTQMAPSHFATRQEEQSSKLSDMIKKLKSKIKV